MSKNHKQKPAIQRSVVRTSNPAARLGDGTFGKGLDISRLGGRGNGLLSFGGGMGRLCRTCAFEAASEGIRMGSLGGTGGGLLFDSVGRVVLSLLNV